MKIAFLSDLHLDYNQKFFKEESLIEKLSIYVKDLNVDLVLISGDMSSDYQMTITIVKNLNESTGKIVKYVPGNHDVWKKDKQSLTSLRAMTDDEHCLVDKTLDLNDDWCAVGSFPWYDFTLETEGNQPWFYEDYPWPDSRFTDWKMPIVNFSQQQLDKTQKIMNKIPSNKNIILLEHFIPLKQFVKIKENNLTWNLGNAFMGSDQIGKLVMNHKNIKIVHFGHTHYPFGETVINGTNFICNPFGYIEEWEKESFEDQLQKATTISEI